MDPISIVSLTINLLRLFKGTSKKKFTKEYSDLYSCTLNQFPKELSSRRYGIPPHVGIVWGTGRHGVKTQCKHPGFISDAMFIPEIILKLHKINRKLDFHSYLDIDVSPEMLKTMNFILCGDGEVNILTCRLLNFVNKASKVKYKNKASPFFQDTLNKVRDHENGVVHLIANPWNLNKFILVIAGVGPIGTIGALRWFCTCLDDMSSLPKSCVALIRADEKKDYSPDYNGYQMLCKSCCGEEKEGRDSYWEGKISNVHSVINENPKW